MDKILNPLVSVIIPCYNQGKYLREAIDCVLNQDYSNLECIVINDGSSDNTESIAQSYAKNDSRVKYIYQNNKGLPAARNTGIKLAKGEFIQLLDSDDIITLEKISIQIRKFHELPKTEIAYSDYLCFHQNERSDTFAYTKPFIISNNPIDDFIFHWPKELILPPHSFLFKSECFQKWGLFDESLKNGEDWDLYLRFSVENAIFSHTPGFLSLYRRHPESICSESNAEQLFQYRIKMMRKHLNNPKLSSKHKKQLRKSIYELAGYEGFENIKKRKVALGIKKIILAIYFSRKPFYYLYHTFFWIKTTYL